MAKTTFRFRDTVAAYDAMMSGIDAGRFAPVYLLMGEESYFIEPHCRAHRCHGRRRGLPATSTN